MTRLVFGLFAFITASAAIAQVPLNSATAGVSFEQRIGEQLPMDTVLREASGANVSFGDAIGGKPAVVVFGYSRCPQLCSVISNATVETLRALRDTAGRDYSVVYVSIDPTDGPRELAAMKQRDVGRYGRTGSSPGWNYLSGEPAAIRRLASAAGFHFTYDERSRLYAHPSGFLVATPEGRISRYFLGIDFAPKDVSAALDRAREGKTGQTVYALLLVCARGLGVSGRYGPLIWGILEVSALATVLAVAGGIGWMVRQERRRNRVEATR